MTEPTTPPKDSPVLASAAPPDIPPDPVLGAVISSHPSERGRPLLYSAVIAGVISVVLNFTIAAIPEWWSPPLTVILMAAVVLALGWYLLHIWNREIILYERGFSYREGSQTVFFQYAEIRALRLRAERKAYFGGLIRRAVYRFTVTTTAGEVFTITNLYRRTAELGERLNERVDLVLLPRLAAQIERGETVTFGERLSLSADGLRAEGGTLAWEHFAGWEVGGGHIRLKSTAGEVWSAVPLAEIDNITILLVMLRARVISARS